MQDHQAVLALLRPSCVARRSQDVLWRTEGTVEGLLELDWRDVDLLSSFDCLRARDVPLLCRNRA